MSQQTTPIRESTLSANLSEYAHSFVRELAMACRKMSIYGTDHPLAVKAVEKPFFALGKIFRFRNYVGLNVRTGQLFLLNILLKESVFNNQILQHLQMVDASAVLFREDMSVKDLSLFVSSLFRRDMVYDPNFHLGKHLIKQGVETVEVNTELAFNIFENRRQYRGDVDGDFSAKRLAMDQLGDDLKVLASLREADPEKLLKYNVDFIPRIVNYLLPEKIAGFDAAEVRAVLTALVDIINSEDAPQEQKDEASSCCLAMFKLLKYHPDHDEIVENLDDWQVNGADSSGDDNDSASATGAIKIESSRRIDDLLKELFAPGNASLEVTEFCDSFVRLLKTGQRSKAEEIVTRLIGLMNDIDPACRQKALNLLAAVTEQLNFTTDSDVMSSAVAAVAKHLERNEETYEYSELIWILFDLCHRERQYPFMAQLTRAMAARRKVNDNVTVYDSMAVKKAFENISRPETINKLIEQLVKADRQEAGYLKDIMVGIGSESLALGLSGIISHPLRPVRQLTLKILAELGKASLKVFSAILMDDAMFARESNRHELSDSKWYVIRNSIFVLGSLRDEQAVHALRSRISDKDIRVRREIISALEKIGGEESVDCLTIMAEDGFGEIRQAAIIAIGLTGKPESAPVLIDIARRNPAESVRCVAALGKLGGSEAHSFLTALLETPEELARLASGGASRDDLRVAVINVLGQLGDKEAIDQIKKFQQTQSVASKLFFKNSSVNKAILKVLSRH